MVGLHGWGYSRVIFFCTKRYTVSREGLLYFNSTFSDRAVVVVVHTNFIQRLLYFFFSPIFFFFFFSRVTASNDIPKGKTLGSASQP